MELERFPIEDPFALWLHLYWVSQLRLCKTTPNMEDD
ncbi:UNVERIFIED_ORG: hypothetical protein ABIC97_000777 [Peribacillus simplex]